LTGKGIVLDDGRVETWGDAGIHHGEGAEKLGANYRDIAVALEIRCDGCVTPRVGYGRSVDLGDLASDLREHHGRLWLDSSQGDNWGFA
jgi:hypothetical protein